MSIPYLTPISTTTALVHLLQCAKQRCGHVLPDNERDWNPSPDWEGSLKAVCPKCGGEGFFTLNAKGQCRMQRDTSPREINPHAIEPSPRMGLKRRRRIIAAKRRILESLTPPANQPTTSGVL